MTTKTKLSINEEAFKKGYTYSQKEIAELNQKLAKCSLRNFKQAKISASLITLNGAHGEIAYIKDCGKSMFDFGKLKIVFEFSLGLEIRLMRDWIKISSRFFKPLFKKEEEVVGSGEIFNCITKKPYKERNTSCIEDEYNEYGEREEYILKSRYRSYKDKTPYGSKTLTRDFYQKRNLWLKQEYSKLRKFKTPEVKCYSALSKKLAALPSLFFAKRHQIKHRKPFTLSCDRIKFIVQSKKK